MKITLVYNNGEISCSRLIESDNFNKAELEKVSAEFADQVEKLNNPDPGKLEECPYCHSTEPCGGTHADECHHPLVS